MREFPAFFKSWAGACFLFTIFFFALLAPLWLLTVDPVWDAYDYYYPIFTYVADSIREGRLALWDPYTNSGEPFHADPQKMVLSPLALLLGLVFKNTFLGFLLMWFIHWWCGGIGMLWLARYFGSNISGAFIAASSYALSGFFLGHSQHTPYVIVAAWLPWIILYADMAVMNSKLWCALLSAFFLSFCAISGGYPMLVTFTGIAVALWLSMRYILLPGPGSHYGRPLRNRVKWVFVTLLLVATIAIAVWSPILHAFLRESVGFTDRLTMVSSKTSLYGEAFSWASALSLFFPYPSILFRKIEWMPNISMANAYMGVFAIPLASLWFLKSEDKRHHLWLLTFAVFMLLVSMGGKAGIRIVLNELFPPLRLMRFNSPFRLYWILPLTLAAGLGFSVLSNSASNRRFFVKILSTLSVCSLVIAYVVYICAHDNSISLLDAFPHVYLPALAVIPTGMALFFVWLKWDTHSVSKIISPLLLLLILSDMGGHLYTNSYTVWANSNVINGLEKLHVRTTSIDGEPPRRTSERTAGYMNAHIIVKMPLVTGYVAFINPDFNSTLSNSKFSKILTASFRFWLVPGVEQLGSQSEVLKILSNSGIKNPVPVFVENPPRIFSPTRVVPGTYGRVLVKRYSPEEIQLQVYVPNSAGAFLASTERYAPGWKAWVDEVPTEVEKVNLFFRGLYLPQGQHTVTWKYKPDGWLLLVVFSYAILISSVGLALFLRLKKV